MAPPSKMGLLLIRLVIQLSSPFCGLDPGYRGYEASEDTDERSTPAITRAQFIVALAVPRRPLKAGMARANVAAPNGVRVGHARSTPRPSTSSQLQGVRRATHGVRHHRHQQLCGAWDFADGMGGRRSTLRAPRAGGSGREGAHDGAVTLPSLVDSQRGRDDAESFRSSDYAVELTNAAREDGTVLKLAGRKDRGRGLLSDVTFALASLSLDVIEGRVRTDTASGAIDNEFVLQAEGAQIDEAEFARVKETVLAACFKSATLSGIPFALEKSLSSSDEGENEDGDLLATAGEGPSTPTASDGGDGFRWTPGALRAAALVNLAAMLFGSNQVLIKLAETEISPGTLNFLRFAIAAVAFFPAGLASDVWKKPENLVTAFELGIYLFIGYTCQVLGLELTTASRGAVMSEFSVLIVPFLSRMTGVRIPRVFWISAVLALAGVTLVTNSGDGGAFNGGDFLCILSAAFFGIHVFRSEQKLGMLESGRDYAGLVSVQLVLLALASGVYEAVDFVRHPGATMDAASLLNTWKALPWPNLVFMGLGTTAFTLWIEITALKDITSTTAALIYTTEPLWGAIFAAAYLHESFGTLGYVGAAMIVGATAVGCVKGSTSKPHEKEA